MPDGFDGFQWTARRGGLKVVQFQVKTDAEPNGANTTTWGKAWITGKRKLSETDAEAVFQITTLSGGGITPLDLTVGLYQGVIPIAALKALPNRLSTLYVDIQILDPAGVPWTVEAGTMVVWPEATLAFS
jgi:hypothetical protein